MPSPRTYKTEGAFRRALEERLKRASPADQIDLNRLRRQVLFDRLLARLFREEPAPWVLKGGYALELRFKAARSTVDSDLTLQRVVAATSAGGDTNQVVREMLQSVADMPLGDWFEYAIGPPVMDLTAGGRTGATRFGLFRLPLAGSTGAATPQDCASPTSYPDAPSPLR